MDHIKNISTVRRMIGLLTTMILSSAAGVAQAVPIPAPEPEVASPWQLRPIISWMRPSNANHPDVALKRIEINDRTYAEMGIARALTTHLTTELLFTYPQQHDMRLRGQKIGKFKLTPLNVVMQYGFRPNATINPYVGVGVNYSRFSSVSLPDTMRMDHHSVGLALQVGADYRLSRQLSVNAGWRRVKIHTDIEAGGTRFTHLKIDPDLLSVGVAYRF